MISAVTSQLYRKALHCFFIWRLSLVIVGSWNELRTELSTRLCTIRFWTSVAHLFGLLVGQKKPYFFLATTLSISSLLQREALYYFSNLTFISFNHWTLMRWVAYWIKYAIMHHTMLHIDDTHHLIDWLDQKTHKRIVKAVRKQWARPGRSFQP